MHFLNENIVFPPINEASPDGLLAIGGDLSPERLLLAYKNGIFPWFSNDEPILWWSPNPRFVLFPEELKVSKSMGQILRKNTFTITQNKAFKDVIENCAQIKRKHELDTWITADMVEAYIKLHQLGYAISVEAWQDDELVGGFYGVDVGNKVFCGESMFAKVSNASKAAFITCIQNTKYKLIDCQIHTEHLESLGARNIPRDEFIKFL